MFELKDLMMGLKCVVANYISDFGWICLKFLHTVSNGAGIPFLSGIAINSLFAWPGWGLLFHHPSLLPTLFVQLKSFNPNKTIFVHV